MANQDFVKYHLVEALESALVESTGDEAHARRLRAQTKLRLICMSDDELWELSRITSCPSVRSVEMAYFNHKEAVKKLSATANQWIKDL